MRVRQQPGGTRCSGPYLLSVQRDIAVQRLEQEVKVAVLGWSRGVTMARIVAQGW